VGTGAGKVYPFPNKDEDEPKISYLLGVEMNFYSRHQIVQPTPVLFYCNP